MAVDNLEFNFVFVSAKEYAKRTGLSYNEVLRFCETGQLEAYKTDGGQWRIKVYKGDTVSREEYNKLFEECNRYKGMVEAVSKLVMG